MSDSTGVTKFVLCVTQLQPATRAASSLLAMSFRGCATLLVCATLLLSLQAVPTATAEAETSQTPRLQGPAVSAAFRPRLLARSLTASCPDGCSGVGTCLSSGACACPAGAMGANCNITSTASEPIHGYTIDGLLGQVMQQEWRMVANNSSPYLHARWCDTGDSWFGGIWNVDTDGMTPASGSVGDTWAYWVSSSGTIYLTDYYSEGRSSPGLDSEQNLVLVNGWRDDTFQCVEFTRTLDTGDEKDVIISAVAGESLRFMWTNGLTVPEMSSSSTSVGVSKKGGGGDGGGDDSMLTMHGYIGYVGQLRIDFAAGTMDEMTDGVEWPVGYYYAIILAAAAIVLPFSILQRDPIKVSMIGRLLRMRPFMRLTSTDGRSRSEHIMHRLTLQFWPTLRGLSAQEVACVLIYFGINIGVAVSSFTDYDHVARSRMYVFGHLFALHLALMLLPASRSSVLLPMFGIGFDIAISWHRRIGLVTVALAIVHLVSMVIVWAPDVLFYTSTCQFGMGSLYGLLSVICLLLLLVSSIEWMRRHHWEWFLYAHILLAVIAFVFALMHSVNLRWLSIVPGALLLVDVALRLGVNPYGRFGGRITSQTERSIDLVAPPTPKNQCARIVRIDCHDGGESSRVVVITLVVVSSRGERTPQPGAHLYLRVPEISSHEMHPFTISTARSVLNGDEQRTFLTIHVLAMQRATDSKTLLPLCASPPESPTFTQRLYSLAASALPPYRSSIVFDGCDDVVSFDAWSCDAPAAVGSTAPFSLLIDGPYHGLNLPPLKYKVLVLVMGGIGVTPAMSILEHYMNEYEARQAAADHREGAAPLTPKSALPLRICLVWTSRTASAFEKWFPRQMQRMRKHAPRIQVQLFLTAASPPDRVKRIQSQQPSHAAAEENLPDFLPTDGEDIPAAVAAVAPASPLESVSIESVDPPASRFHPAGRDFAFSVVSGRPIFPVLFTSLAHDLASSADAASVRPHDVLVFSCGPEPMIDSAEWAAEQAGYAFTHEAFEF